jgi:uncharacterized membrane protein YfcA
LLVAHVSRAVFDPLMGAVLGVLAVWLIVGKQRPPHAHRWRWTATRELVDARGERYAYQVPLVRGALYSLAVGFVSSFLGIGGGVIHVPLLVRALGFPTHIATATSHFVLAIMAGTGTVTHVLAGGLRYGHGLRRGLGLSVGVVAGAQLGAHVSLRLGARTIQWLLALALAALAARLLLSL